MNSALYLLNAVALVALVSFHYSSDSNDPAEIHFNASHSVHRPAAQLAVMDGHSSFGTFANLQDGQSASATARAPEQARSERYTF